VIGGYVKVKMDVMKPWIAKQVTELLGFEDGVLINFIYGLLEEKVFVQVQQCCLFILSFLNCACIFSGRYLLTLKNISR
jgi:hypothetical protein